MRKALLVFVVLSLIAGCCPCRTPFKRSALLMGTIVRVELGDDIDFRSLDGAYKSAINRMRALSQKLDYFSNTSEVTAVNNAGDNGMINVSEDVFAAVKLSRGFYELTGGSFDMTIAPLMELWGFYAKEKGPRSIPDKEGVKEALNRVGSDKILLDAGAGSVGFAKSGMKIDLGGIAKGYIVDEAVKRLKERGVKNALVEAGGDIYCAGRAGNKPWRIGIQHPVKKNKVFAVVELSDSAIATSGPYENFVIIEGKAYPHIVNPKTGFPVKNDILSVTVIGPSCAEADAVATAVFVLGEEDGVRLVESLRGFDCVIIKGGESGLMPRISKNIKDKIKFL